MKKPKKKRQPNKQYSGDAQIEPVMIDILDEPTEMNMVFSFSNRGLKMLKAGHVFSKTFLRDGKTCIMQFMHRDVYDDDYKKQIEIRRRLIKQQQDEATANAEGSATKE